MRLSLFKPTGAQTQGFGDNVEFYKNLIGTNGHPGIDFQASMGQSLLAAHDGVVLSAEIDSKGGLGIEVRTENFVELDNFPPSFIKTGYWHCQSFLKKPGDRVKEGEAIALADNTGISTGPHNHFFLKRIDPFTHETLDRDNGFYGGIDPSPYWKTESVSEWKLRLLIAFFSLLKALGIKYDLETLKSTIEKLKNQ